MDAVSTNIPLVFYRVSPSRLRWSRGVTTYSVRMFWPCSECGSIGNFSFGDCGRYLFLCLLWLCGRALAPRVWLVPSQMLGNAWFFVLGWCVTWSYSLLYTTDLAWFWVWEHRCFPVSVVADSVPVSVSLWLCGHVLASTTGYSRSVWLGPSLGLRNAW